jgi:galactokinase
VRSRVRKLFRERFGRAPEALVRAPGRVNLIGEHTDYNEGLVLPCAVDRDTVVASGPRSDRSFRVFSREQGAVRGFDADRLERGGGWDDYVRGVVFALEERGIALPGADLALASEVSPGSGLSSSAALTVGVVTALDRCHALGLGPLERARVAHRAETGFVGVPCGIMDPWASALGRSDTALRIDCRSEAVTHVPLPAGRASLLVAHSGVERRLAEGGYADRRGECATALAAARRAGVAPPRARALRDLDEEDLPALSRVLEPHLLRRVRHVLGENRRVDAVVSALECGNLAAVGALLSEGQRSLRDDFEVSLPELDTLCAIADRHPAVYGSRLTGAGFGGCTLHLCVPDAADDVTAALARGFAERFGRHPEIRLVHPAAGAGVVD